MIEFMASVVGGSLIISASVPDSSSATEEFAGIPFQPNMVGVVMLIAIVVSGFGYLLLTLDPYVGLLVVSQIAAATLPKSSARMRAFYGFSASLALFHQFRLFGLYESVLVACSLALIMALITRVALKRLDGATRN